MNEYQLIKQIGKCPKCGCKEFVVNAKVDGEVPYFVNLDGEECDNSDMYSGLDYQYDEWCVCAKCENKLFKYKDYYASCDFLLE